MKKVSVIENVFPQPEFNRLKRYLMNKQKDPSTFDKGFGRYTFRNKMIDVYSMNLLLLARQTFNSKTLLPSYSLFAHYEGENASLYKHKDDNACTYTLDFCVYQTEPWDLFVDDQAYTLQENQALAYYGNEQMHWREKFPNPENQHVAMIFFHFVEPDHWWFTKGESYLDVIRGKVSEEEWNKRRH